MYRLRNKVGLLTEPLAVSQKKLLVHGLRAQRMYSSMRSCCFMGILGSSFRNKEDLVCVLG